MKEQEILICGRDTDRMIIPGSALDQHCSKCGVRVMIAPSGQERLKRNPEMQVMCLQCAMPLIQDTDKLELASSPETTVDELSKAVPNTYNRRN